MWVKNVLLQGCKDFNLHTSLLEKCSNAKFIMLDILAYKLKG